MTDESRGIGGTIGPPWSVDVLADLHAGALDEARAAELWPLVNADPEARAILDALDATQADLAALATAPAEPIPAQYAARIDAALAAEARQAAPFPAQTSPAPEGAEVVDLAAARRRRAKRIGWAAGVLTAAAAAVVAVAIAVPRKSTDGTSGIAAPSPTGPSVDNEGKGAQALLGGGLGVRDFGPLQNEQKLDVCLAANGLDPKVRPDGIRPVNVGGKAGVLVIYTTGKFAQYRMVAFGADCGPGNPSKLFDRIVGEK